MKKMCYIYTLEFYSAIEKSEIMAFADKWLEVESTLLSEICQSQKIKG